MEHVSEPKGRYADEASILLRENGVWVTKWRTTNSGIAYNLKRGTSGPRLIEAPSPTNPSRLGIISHEIAHHVLGHTATGANKPRWLEEQEAWEWAVAVGDQIGVPVPHILVRLSLEYALKKAILRGMLTIPDGLRPYLSEPVLAWAEERTAVKAYQVRLLDGSTVFVQAQNTRQAIARATGGKRHG